MAIPEMPSLPPPPPAPGRIPPVRRAPLARNRVEAIVDRAVARAVGWIQPWRDELLRWLASRLAPRGIVGFTRLGAILLAGAVAIAWAAWQEPGPPGRASRALAVAQRFVDDRLTCPSTAQHPRSCDGDDVAVALAGDAWRVIAYVDAQNSFGAMVRTRYAATVRCFVPKERRDAEISAIGDDSYLARLMAEEPRFARCRRVQTPAKDGWELLSLRFERQDESGVDRGSEYVGSAEDMAAQRAALKALEAQEKEARRLLAELEKEARAMQSGGF